MEAERPFPRIKQIVEKKNKNVREKKIGENKESLALLDKNSLECKDKQDRRNQPKKINIYVPIENNCIISLDKKKWGKILLFYSFGLV